jgi:hypothetical protein
LCQKNSPDGDWIVPPSTGSNRPRADIRQWHKPAKSGHSAMAQPSGQVKFFQKMGKVVDFWLVVRHMSLLAVCNSCVILPGKSEI